MLGATPETMISIIEADDPASQARLVAAQWGALPSVLQFLTLVGGALAVHGLGDVARRRLRLPTAAAALTFLFVAMVPLLAWGAARLDLLVAPLGWAALAVGLGALMWASRRVLDRLVDYRGVVYPAALAVLLAAIPILGFLDAHAADSATFFLVAALALGSILRFAGQHINRFLFHRDRVRGHDRPVHALPFALLAATYVGAMSGLDAIAVHLALVVALVGAALVDMGEEYYRALVDALAVSGEGAPERWPRRSVGLLTVGFGLLATGGVLGLLDGSGRSLALASSFAAWTLMRWAWRYRSTAANVFGLAAGLVAYHSMPTLIPAAVREGFWSLAAGLGIDHGSPAALGLADLVPLAAILALGAVARRRGLGAKLEGVHAVFAALQTMVVVSAALLDPVSLLAIAPVAVLLLAAGFWMTRRPELLPALAHVVVAVVFAVHPTALLLSDFVVVAGGLAMVHILGLVAASLVGSALRDVDGPPSASARFGAELLGVWAALQVLAVSPLFDDRWIAWIFLAAVLAVRGVQALLRRRDAELGRIAIPMISALLMAVAGWIAVVSTLETSGAPWWPVLPGFFASLYFVDLARRGRETWVPALFGAGYFVASMWALFHHLSHLGGEIYWLAPGLALLGLSKILEREVGEGWSKRLFTAGAFCLYAMPVLGLLDTLSWGWQSVLLLLAVGFGAASFRLESRSLLILSTAALLVDLACFLLKLHQTAPMLLWVAGVAFGLSLMAVAAFLEHRRELVLQRVRVWRREFGAWS